MRVCFFLNFGVGGWGGVDCFVWVGVGGTYTHTHIYKYYFYIYITPNKRKAHQW